MKQFWPIIKDAIILITVSTIFVTMCNKLFTKLKKSNVSDTLVTAIVQNNEKRLNEVLSEKGQKDEAIEGVELSFADYLKERVNRVDEHLRTPLMWASYVNLSNDESIATLDGKRMPLVQRLIAEGADINAKDKDGWSSLMWASWSGLKGVSSYLVEKGAEINVADENGNTALMLAAQKGRLEVVDALLAGGADINMRNLAGKSAVDFAKEWGKRYPDSKTAYDAILAKLEQKSAIVVDEASL